MPSVVEAQLPLDVCAPPRGADPSPIGLSTMSPVECPGSLRRFSDTCCGGGWWAGRRATPTLLSSFDRLGGFSGGVSLDAPLLPASSLTRNIRNRGHPGPTPGLGGSVREGGGWGRRGVGVGMGREMTLSWCGWETLPPPAAVCLASPCCPSTLPSGCCCCTVCASCGGEGGQVAVAVLFVL